MSNTKPWMDEDDYDEIVIEFRVLDEESGEYVMMEDNYLNFGEAIKKAAADHYEPLLEAKEKEVEEWKQKAFNNRQKWIEETKENATLKAEVERLKGENEAYRRTDMGIHNELTHLRTSAKDNAIKFADQLDFFPYTYSGNGVWTHIDDDNIKKTTSELYEEWEKSQGGEK